ncbi:MAG: sensor histidine kinase [Gemmatimonadota bacterium]
MGGRRSDSEDRPSRNDPELPRPGEDDGAERLPSEGRTRPGEWWDWRAAVDDLDPPIRAVAESLARTVETGGASGDLTSSLADFSGVGLRESWKAVSRLHRSLDRCRGSAPPAEFEEVRRRLDEVCEQLWASGVESEVRAVREFVREVAHDFRSPLHSIIFLTDALFREESGPLTRTQKRQVSVVHSAAAALLRMANDLLDLSGPSEKPVYEGVAEIPFSPIQVVDDLENLLEPVSHHHKARLDTELDDAGSRVGDPQVLNRILLNLASNAMEAVDEEGRVRIRVTGDDDTLRAVVEDDSGEADLERIHELVNGGSYPDVIRRLGGQTRGLGLVICGRMVRAADGELSVECTDEGWTRISVALPFPVLGEET